MFNLTLEYADGTTWFAGCFNTMDALNDWLDIEKTRPYWDNSTITAASAVVMSAS